MTRIVSLTLLAVMMALFAAGAKADAPGPGPVQASLTAGEIFQKAPEAYAARKISRDNRRANKPRIAPRAYIDCRFYIT
jgi:hypothetical protein